MLNKSLFAALMLGSVAFAAEAAPPRLKVAGNTLQTVEGGRNVTLRGVSLCGLNWQEFRKDIADAAREWQADVIRLPVQPREWKRLGAEAYLRDFLDPAVKQCKDSGVYCIVDWHEIRNWQDEAQNAELERFWDMVAPRYADEPHILYEVFNEPTSPATRNRDNWLKWRETAQPWVNDIREKAPETVILVGSPHWSQMPRFAEHDPFEGDNLMYVMHIYPSWPNETWHQMFGWPSKAIPIFVTEWGWSMRESERKTEFFGTQQSYGDPLKAYLDARPQISWTAWSYHEDCGPAMLTKDADMGGFVREWLTGGEATDAPQQ